LKNDRINWGMRLMVATDEVHADRRARSDAVGIHLTSGMAWTWRRSFSRTSASSWCGWMAMRRGRAVRRFRRNQTYVRERCRARQGCGAGVAGAYRVGGTRRGTDDVAAGDRQEAAIRLYTRAGFRRCPAFGVYAVMASKSVSTRLFFEKPLAVSEVSCPVE
jgi:hypothetical protein